MWVSAAVPDGSVPQGTKQSIAKILDCRGSGGRIGAAWRPPATSSNESARWHTIWCAFILRQSGSPASGLCSQGWETPLALRPPSSHPCLYLVRHRRFS